jgi:hypothetical protein
MNTKLTYSPLDHQGGLTFGTKRRQQSSKARKNCQYNGNYLKMGVQPIPGTSYRPISNVLQTMQNVKYNIIIIHQQLSQTFREYVSKYLPLAFDSYSSGQEAPCKLVIKAESSSREHKVRDCKIPREHSIHMTYP